MISEFLTGWLVTLVLEVPVLILLLKRAVNWKKVLLPGVVASSLTLPWLWFVLPYWLSHEQLLTFGELGVVLVETVVLAGWLRIGWPKALLVSFLANLCSLLVGNLILYSPF